MSLRGGTIGALGATCVLAAAGGAHATTFSFASDDDTSFLTFAGTSGAGGSFSIRNGRTPASTPVNLEIDDDNGPLPTAVLPVGLIVDITATHSMSLPAGGGAQAHLYSLMGSYRFVHPTTGDTLLNVLIGAGRQMAVTGTASSWGSAGSIFSTGTPAADPLNVQYQTGSLIPYAASLGISLPLETNPFDWIREDFSYTMTLVNMDGGSVNIDPGTKLPIGQWGAEASHSGHAIAVPAPAAAGLGLFGLAAGTRRRRRR